MTLKENQKIVESLLYRVKEFIEQSSLYDFVTFAGDNASVIVKDIETNTEYRICITREEE